MNSLINDIKIKNTLKKLHSESAKDMTNIIKGFVKSFGRKLKPEDIKNAYIALSEEQGKTIYSLSRIVKCKTIVEFGTSFGITTIYLAASAKDNSGNVFTSEIIPEKYIQVRKNFEEAGLTDYITLFEGNALETLKNVPDEIDFLLMDGCSDLY
ncbi:MAG: class I SAM-dependent methyltransferase [Candidatus Sericytochromatia bacterium]